MGKLLRELLENLLKKAEESLKKKSKLFGTKEKLDVDANAILDKAYSMATGRPLLRIFLRRAKRANVLHMTADDVKELKTMGALLK